MSLTPTRKFGGLKLEPIVSPDLARTDAVRIAANLTIPRGTAMGQITAGVDPVQTIVIAGTPTAGVLALGFGGFTTADIPFATLTDATAANAQTAVLNALQALDSIGTGNIASVVRSGTTPNFTFTVTFGGTMAGQPAQLITVAKQGLTGGTANVTTANATVGVVAGSYRPALAGSSDGSQTPKGLLAFDVVTNAYGGISLSDEGGAMGGSVYLNDTPVYTRGEFRVGDLTGLSGLTLPSAWMYSNGAGASDPEAWLKLP